MDLQDEMVHCYFDAIAKHRLKDDTAKREEWEERALAVYEAGHWSEEFEHNLQQEIAQYIWERCQPPERLKDEVWYYVGRTYISHIKRFAQKERKPDYRFFELCQKARRSGNFHDEESKYEEWAIKAIRSFEFHDGWSLSFAHELQSEIAYYFWDRCWQCSQFTNEAWDKAARVLNKCKRNAQHEYNYNHQLAINHVGELRS